MTSDLGINGAWDRSAGRELVEKFPPKISKNCAGECEARQPDHIKIQHCPEWRDYGTTKL